MSAPRIPSHQRDCSCPDCTMIRDDVTRAHYTRINVRDSRYFESAAAVRASTLTGARHNATLRIGVTWGDGVARGIRPACDRSVLRAFMHGAPLTVSDPIFDAAKQAETEWLRDLAMDEQGAYRDLRAGLRASMHCRDGGSDRPMRTDADKPVAAFVKSAPHPGFGTDVWAFVRARHDPSAVALISRLSGAPGPRKADPEVDSRCICEGCRAADDLITSIQAAIAIGRALNLALTPRERRTGETEATVKANVERPWSGTVIKRPKHRGGVRKRTAQGLRASLGAIAVDRRK